MRWLLLVFVVVPLGELYLLLWLSERIGYVTTVAVTLITGVIGGTLAKREGLRVVRQWLESIEQRQSPTGGLAEAVLVLIGGVLLITPGVVTDAAGLLLIVPQTRRIAARRLQRAADAYLARHAAAVVFHSPRGGGPPGGRRPVVVETTGETSAD